MATKQRELNDLFDGKGLLARVESNEPIFILRAQDRLAPLLVWMWGSMAWWSGCPRAKVSEAFDVMRAMRRWPRRKFPD
jgi:hypothetical protein